MNLHFYKIILIMFQHIYILYCLLIVQRKSLRNAGKKKTIMRMLPLNLPLHRLMVIPLMSHLKNQHVIIFRNIIIIQLKMFP